MDLDRIVQIIVHCSLWSVLSIGGNTVALSDIYRYTVEEARWVSATQFVAFFAISQALPGPNGMALVLIGFQAAGVHGAFAALVAKLVPSSFLAYIGASWYEQNQGLRWVRIIKDALIPITVGLTLAATFILIRAVDIRISRGVLTLLATFMALRYKSNPIWIIALGVAIGVASALMDLNIF